MAGRKRELQRGKLAMDRRLSRGMEQWARALVVFDGDQVRRLTEREVRIVADRQTRGSRRAGVSARSARRR